MSSLRSVIEELISADVGYLSDAELTEEASEVARALGLLTHRLAAVTGEVDARGSFQGTGFRNATRWLATIGDMGSAVARHLVGLGRMLRRHPETGRKAATGDLSQARVRHLARAARRYPDLYGEHEPLLLDLAENMTLDEFKAAIDYWIYLADDNAGEKKADKQQDETRLHASQTSGGMLKLDGLFDKVTGEAILTALNAAMTPEARKNGAGDDLRPASRRRADALHDICRQFLDHHPGRIGGHRPHVSLILDLETLERRAGWRCELDHMGTITPETARRLLCDAELSWLIVNSKSAPLNMGRSVRTATPAQLRALAVRDGGCTWKGCDIPPAWCDAHHDIPWERGGPTDLENLRLLCRRHHVLVHRSERDTGPRSEKQHPPPRTRQHDLRDALAATAGARPRGP